MISENLTKNPWSDRPTHFEGLFRARMQHIPENITLKIATFVIFIKFASL